jgi:hypothetical protein
LQEPVPFADTGSPKWNSERDAQDGLGERRRRDLRNNGVYPLNEPIDRLPPVPGACTVQVETAAR